ncbi:polysaccharide deacetylase family protein [Planomonospora sp. ID67723]|uniref:polysaccharide deacetylase family protein n=1 Tax=Planomonospora sp. ID67723 TaxID=2738134 RepID=UPI0018C447D8|nr:polysaccharide deacetylase family protein [Planomonospora sp. ID67723]MBG0827455.1 polysaccharide deacetylase family protein [Planomonospora sp. ID67723]
MRKLRFAGGITLLTATMLGCGAATTSIAAEELLPSEPTLIEYVDPSRIQGLSTETITQGDSGDRRAHAVYPVLDDAPHLTEKLRTVVSGQLDRFRRATAAGTATASPELNVDWQLAAASDQVVGVRLGIGEFAGTGWANSRTTVWYDRVEERAMDSTGLLKDRSALTVLAALAREELAGRRTGVDADAVRADERLFDSIAFNRHGDLVVEFDDYQVAAGSLGRVAVAVPGERVENLLSPSGRRARQAAVAVRETTVPVSYEKTIETTVAGGPEARSTKAGTVDCAKAKCVALTYDDGPGPDTGRLLDVLNEHGARATFFTLGANAYARPELLRRMSEEGHLVANHTWSHRSLSSLSTSKIAHQLTRGQQAITHATGQTPALMRPPYGAVDREVTEVAGRLGLSVVRWSVDTEDLRAPDAGAVARRAVSGAGQGAIILMHDVHRPTVEATPEILRTLSERGYTFVTVPELYGSAGMRPGTIYDSGPTPAR